MMPGFATQTFNAVFSLGGNQHMPASLSLCRLFNGRRKKIVALTASVALLASSLLPRLPLNAQACQDMARAAIGQSVMCAFFYHSSLPLLIISKYFKDVREKTGGQNSSNSKNETPSGAASESAVLVSAKTVVKVKNTTGRSGTDPVLPVFVKSRNDRSRHSNPIPLYPGGMQITFILLFFFLLPRSNIEGESIRRTFNRVLSRFVNARTGFFYLSIINHSGRQS